MLNNLRIILLPFSLLYGLIIWCRNKMYDWKIFKSTGFDIPTICVGNLAVGGSGKTPTTEYLVRLLAEYKVAILSRGYGRNTKGFILADENATADTIGDEPLQYFQKFKDVKVAVCEDRTTGMNLLKDSCDVIILDDAFQHRKVTAGFNILLFEYQKLRKPQFLLPAGNLRDIFSSRKRADVLVVTKSPIPLPTGSAQIADKLLKPNNGQQVLHSYLKYNELISLHEDKSCALSSILDYEIFLLTGIANPSPLMAELEKYSKNIQHAAYPDHYNFKEADILKLKSAYESSDKKEKIIITTEKDSKRLKTAAFKDILLNLPVYILPIAVEFFNEDKITFDQLILNYVKSNRGNR